MFIIVQNKQILLSEDPKGRNILTHTLLAYYEQQNRNRKMHTGN